MKRYILAVLFSMLLVSTVCFGQARADDDTKYQLLATTKTSTMQKELDEFSARGFRILVGAPTSDAEMAIFMTRDKNSEDGAYQYKLLATTRTGTMQKELNELSASGYRLLPRTMIAKDQLFGATEIVLIMEKPARVTKIYEYKLLATSRTSTLQKEVDETQRNGFVIVGMVSRGEHMIIMERESDSAQ